MRHETRAEPGHWSECGRAVSVGDSDALGRPHRSVLSFGTRPCLAKNMLAASLTLMQKELFVAARFLISMWTNLPRHTLDTYMAKLSPELITRFQQNLQVTDVERPFAKPDDITRWRRAEALIAG